MAIPPLFQRLGLLLASTTLALSALAAEPQKIRLGINDSPQNAALERAAEVARERGVEVEIVAFSDWNTPNLALAHGDIDVNSSWKTPTPRTAMAWCPSPMAWKTRSVSIPNG